MQKSNKEIIQELLLEFKTHRNAVMKMIEDIETLKENVDRLFPTKLEARYARFFDEKVKSVTEFFKTLLEMRKEIQKSLKEEIELRRKIDIETSDSDVAKIIDVRALADKVESFQAKRKEMREGTIEKARKETDQIAGEIVTVQESG